MNEKLAAAIDHFLSNWKSTVANGLTIALIGIGFLLNQPHDQLIAHGLSESFLWWSGSISGLLKLYVALITKDTK